MPKQKGSKSIAKAKPSNVAAAVEPPSWPAFKPPLPLTDLQPESLLDDRVVLIRNFWPKSLCRDYASFLRTLPLTTTPGQPKRGDAVRVNDRFQVHDQAFANRLWLETGLRDVLMGDDWKALWGGDAVGLSPNIRIYRYKPKQFFDAHSILLGYLAARADRPPGMLTIFNEPGGTDGPAETQVDSTNARNCRKYLQPVIEFSISMYKNPDISMGNSRDLAFAAARPSMILRYHHDYPLSLCMCMSKYGHKRDRADTPLWVSFCGKFMQALGRAAADRDIRLAQFATGFSLLNHQAELHDDSNTIISEFDRGKPITTKTTWTLLLYLTSAADGCRGGETVFFPNDRRVAKEEVAVAPETGMVLLHKHGDDCMLHEGREVTAGEKWIIRSDICVSK